MTGLMLYDLRFIYTIYDRHLRHRDETKYNRNNIPLFSPGVFERDGFYIPQIHGRFIFSTHLIFGSFCMFATIHNIWSAIRESNFNRHKSIGKLYLLSVTISFLPTLKMSMDFPHRDYKIINGIIMGLSTIWMVSTTFSSHRFTFPSQ